MYLWKPNSCLHQLDVQEANVSIPRFHRIRNPFIGCWTVNGWITCSRPLGCGNWSVTFIEEYRINNPSGSKKLLAKSQIQNPNKRETEMLINCRMWTTPPQTHILLKASISCTSVKIMRLWSRWLSKVEIQQWDVSRTHRVALDWLFDRINLKPNPKSNMLTPKTNLLTCSPKGVSRVTSGIFFDCSTSRDSRCSLAAISAILFLIRSESRVTCQTEVKKRLPVGNLYGQWLQGQRFRTWSTQTINTWRKSSIFSKEVGNYSKVLSICTWSIKDQCVDMVNVHVFVNESSHSSWTKLFWRTCESTRTRTSTKFRVYSISHRNWFWSILNRFWMRKRLRAHLPHGRDRHCLMIKWSSGQRQKCVYAQIPYCVWWRCLITEMQL